MAPDNYYAWGEPFLHTSLLLFLSIKYSLKATTGTGNINLHSSNTIYRPEVALTEVHYLCTRTTHNEDHSKSMSASASSGCNGCAGNRDREAEEEGSAYWNQLWDHQAGRFPRKRYAARAAPKRNWDEGPAYG